MKSFITLAPIFLFIFVIVYISFTLSTVYVYDIYNEERSALDQLLNKSRQYNFFLINTFYLSIFINVVVVVYPIGYTRVLSAYR